ncbi:alpha/beta hydrolase-fold protein [Nocardioides jiangxiensis]|uniref:Acyl-CoA:diacylglycerol acyltransferase n=1 Tax=Nocardioides jiangxiensis TaxID=3064524 RepID=A0ABT9B788_9ACTN|nr:alpha/beta hydrolase-fold protein [Nocardioides sp. WY-20]MDO7869447.1 alpha/beta hydrolase-fold protein [Nocardioides sp. WY-20]
MGLTRRGLLTLGVTGTAVVAGAGALVEADRVPGVRHHRLEHGTLRGSGWWISRPAGGGDQVPVVIALHGAYNDADQWRRKVAVDEVHAASGARFAIAGIDGGEHDYWHPRAAGRDPRALVLDHFLPLLEQKGLDVSRPAWLGWSMGGYGALVLATEVRRSGPVVATSPALWSRYADTAPGAYDGASDFARWSVLGNRRRLTDLSHLAVRVDCGERDPFVPGVQELHRELPSAGVHWRPGAHDAAYWRKVLPAQLRWLDARV